jgi:hypothetical protein
MGYILDESFGSANNKKSTNPAAIQNQSFNSGKACFLMNWVLAFIVCLGR